MAWTDIIGHDREKRILQKAIIDGKISHSYCLWGIPGIGKDAMAIEFAKTVNCSAPVIEGDSIEACGECRSCKQAAHLSHQNIFLIFSYPTAKNNDTKSDSPLAGMSDEQIEEIQEQIRLKAENPYYKISIPGANQIKIASVREIKRTLSLSGFNEGRRCVIVSGADEMTSEAANAFLKTLEEPHDNITIFMTTAKHDSILPTILSRCQQIRVSPIPDAEIVRVLIEKHNYSPAEARLAATIAQGSYTRALEALDDTAREFRLSIVDLLRTAMKKNTFRAELIDKINELIKGKDKNMMDKALLILLFWIRDVYSLAATGSSENIINLDQIDIIQKFASAYGKKDLSRAADEIERTSYLIKRNVNPQLAFINLFVILRQILLG